MSGGCAPFQVFAQNRWKPYGAAIRAQPNVLSELVGTEPGNFSLSVNGWVYSRPAYPTNTPPWNNGVWYHLTDGAGWVSLRVRVIPAAAIFDALRTAPWPLNRGGLCYPGCSARIVPAARLLATESA